MRPVCGTLRTRAMALQSSLGPTAACVTSTEFINSSMKTKEFGKFRAGSCFTLLQVADFSVTFSTGLVCN
jgi:hypothetical protein